MRNLILNTDSYKASHSAFYPRNSTGQFGYIEARAIGKLVVPFGLQMFIKEYLMTPITQRDIDEAEDVLTTHGLGFANKKGWERILAEYGGFLPITIKGVPEGTVSYSREPIVTIETNDAELFWLTSYIETALQRAIWYPTTVASNDYRRYQQVLAMYKETSGLPESAADFALHDFGSRGVSSAETAAIGGVAHLVNFKGTDNLAGLLAARKYYNCKMAGFSIPATEHSVQCAYGDANQIGYINRVLCETPVGGVVSIVLDGYDIFRDVELLCSKFKEVIIENKLRVVIRPDSGEPLEVIPKLLSIADSHFGSKINNKGYSVINNISILQGDGIDNIVMYAIMREVRSLRYSAEMVIYGSGGNLLQRVNRDDFSFAQKTSAMCIDGEWVDTIKKPITDRSKTSKGGRFESLDLVTFYENGKLLIDDSLDMIRARIRSNFAN